MKYVSVRRLLIYLKETIYTGTQWAVNEPNGKLGCKLSYIYTATIKNQVDCT